MLKIHSLNRLRGVETGWHPRVAWITSKPREGEEEEMLRKRRRKVRRVMGSGVRRNAGEKTVTLSPITIARGKLMVDMPFWLWGGWALRHVKGIEVFQEIAGGYAWKDMKSACPRDPD